MREDLQVETLHIEATELREHTSMAKFSYMNFWDFFLKIWMILVLGKLHSSKILSYDMYLAKNRRRHLLMTLWSKELELERFQV